jgi:hypothetical protein
MTAHPEQVENAHHLGIDTADPRQAISRRPALKQRDLVPRPAEHGGHRESHRPATHYENIMNFLGHRNFSVHNHQENRVTQCRFAYQIHGECIFVDASLAYWEIAPASKLILERLDDIERRGAGTLMLCSVYGKEIAK